MDALKSGWFSELNSSWPGESFSLEVQQVLHQEKSNYQNILVFKRFAESEYTSLSLFVAKRMVTFWRWTGLFNAPRETSLRITRWWHTCLCLPTPILNRWEPIVKYPVVCRHPPQIGQHLCGLVGHSPTLTKKEGQVSALYLGVTSLSRDKYDRSLVCRMWDPHKPWWQTSSFWSSLPECLGILSWSLLPWVRGIHTFSPNLWKVWLSFNPSSWKVWLTLGYVLQSDWAAIFLQQEVWQVLQRHYVGVDNRRWRWGDPTGSGQTLQREWGDTLWNRWGNKMVD